MVVGCNTERRTLRQEKRALKAIHKAELKAPNELAKWCAKRYNPIDSIHETTDTAEWGAIPADTQYIEIDCDSLIRVSIAKEPLYTDTFYKPKSTKYKIACPPCDSIRILGVMKSRFERAANTAALDSMKAYNDKIVGAKDKQISELSEALATTKQALKTWRSIGIGAMIAIALYFIVKFIIRKFIIRKFKGR